MSDFGDQDITQAATKCIAFIEKAKTKGKKILVHWYVLLFSPSSLLCNLIVYTSISRGGVNRSATIVLAYLVAREGYNLKDAFFHVKHKYCLLFPLLLRAH